MAASREDVDSWIELAKSTKHKYIISVCDTFEWDDYPVFCKNKKELQKQFPKYNGENMQRVNEIIRINPDGSVDENLSISKI
ncbi:MAG: hypothetical protein GYA51_00815 [Candidatus Methanofastidiosa archaeon]|jgi:hypothetical protein|nr:hypothetical protein [Candidatus Methanofastidiosa archaeon]